MTTGKESAPHSAGRGVLFLTISKAYFIASGYAIFFGLTRLLTREMFGLYALVTGIASVLGDVLIRGTIQSVSKFVSEEPARAGSVKRAALRLQLMAGGGLFLAYLLSAPLIARFLNDPSTAAPLALSSLIVVSYAFYAVYMGYINGLKRFGKQAALDMTFSTLKMLLVFGLAAAGLGVMGAIGGFGLAALLILCIASAAAPRVSCAGPVRIAHLFSFQLYISMFTVISNLCLKTDLFLLKRLSPAAESDLLAAYYASAQALAFIPYQAIISVTFVIFPLVSRLTYIQDTAQVREYIREALRYSLLLTLLIAVLFSSNAQGTVRLLFPRGYENAGQALSILVFGIVFFSLFLVGATIISGSGRVAHSVLIGVGTLLLDVFLNSRLIPAHGLRGAAAATTAAMFAGLAATWVYLPMRFGRCLPAGAVIRGCAAAGAVYAVSVLTPGHGILLIGKFAILALLYLAILMALGEIGSADLARARRIAKTF